uniref:Secreted protein n=1 Tax=Ditylum brightwellii TaxID=49249 RepID=A0A7S4TAA1_9STRA
MVSRMTVLLIVFLESDLLLIARCLNIVTLVEDVVGRIHNDRGDNHEVPEWRNAIPKEEVFERKERRDNFHLFLKRRVGTELMACEKMHCACQTATKRGAPPCAP